MMADEQINEEVREEHGVIQISPEHRLRNGDEGDRSPTHSPQSSPRKSDDEEDSDENDEKNLRKRKRSPSPTTKDTKENEDDFGLSKPKR